MVAVKSIEPPSPLKLNMFVAESGNNPPKADEVRKAG